MGDISMKRGHSTIQPDIRRKNSTIQLSYIKNHETLEFKFKFLYMFALFLKPKTFLYIKFE